MIARALAAGTSSLKQGIPKNGSVGGYRPDIDGLRAIAVAGVVIYHFGSSWLPGGFTGVDVFFVISGFLITSIIRKEIAEDAFSFLAFYGRRIRRILPALAFMLLTLLIGGWYALMPSDYVLLARSAKYAALGWSNFFFHRNTDYFDVSADLQPLLHTWSLGVEEQFYLVWPLFLLIVIRRWGIGRKLKLSLLLALLGSLFYAVWLTYHDPKSAFYLPHARAWELLAGAAICFARPIASFAAAQSVGAVGVALIASSFVLINSSHSFPGINAIWAVTGAALLLWPKAQATIVSSALSLKPMVGLGLISYSLYLWHWPVLVYFRYFTLKSEPTVYESIMLGGLSVFLSVISYFAVERPFRKASYRVTIVVALAGASALVTAVMIAHHSGYPGRLPNEVVTLAKGADDYSQNRPKCHRGDDNNLQLSQRCILGYTATPPTTVMWGDSHGMELADTIGAQLVSSKGSILNLTYSSCPPVVGYVSKRQSGCSDFVRNSLEQILADKNIATVLISARYDLYLGESDLSEFERGLEASIASLLSHKKRVIIFRATPSFQFSVPQAAGRLLQVGELRRLFITTEEYGNLTRKSGLMIDRLFAKYPSLNVVDPKDALCFSGTCPLLEGGKVIFFDDNHLSMHGAGKVSRLVVPYLVENPK